jgi:hypothetical protein
MVYNPIIGSTFIIWIIIGGEKGYQKTPRETLKIIDGTGGTFGTFRSFNG